MKETAEKAMDITPAEPKAASLVARLRELADQLDSSHQAGDVLQTELNQSAEQLMKQAETQKEVNQEAEEAQEFIDALHQVSGRTNKGPAKHVISPEARVDPLPGRLQHLWDKQWRMLDESAAANKAYLQDNERPPHSSNSSGFCKMRLGIYASWHNEAPYRKGKTGTPPDWAR